MNIMAGRDIFGILTLADLAFGDQGIVEPSGVSAYLNSPELASASSS
jgi:hypothetical protein